LRELEKEGFEIKDSYFKSAEGWTEEQKRNFVINDNIADGEWDYDLLANEWDEEDLESWGVDLPIGWGLNPEDLPDSFNLPDGEKLPFQQMTFTLADQQADLIKEALDMAKDLNFETYDNENSNGNKLYWIVKQWVELKTS
jgi:hypothetical protein